MKKIILYDCFGNFVREIVCTEEKIINETALGSSFKVNSRYDFNIDFTIFLNKKKEVIEKIKRILEEKDEINFIVEEKDGQIYIKALINPNFQIIKP
ncbi:MULTISPECIES: hypothetical protein [Fusobacterium]|uniref:hypothetical protein n=1 Tax=Fusobacterium TaxID=848 RepID=UPI0014776AD2|nr:MULTISPECIES: hypothetical protein [Fusobacterium]NME35373.1 hypothetical protein [Fusobacterium sp. FSA-380-WT-3A]